MFKVASFCVLCSKWPVSACCVQSGQFLRAVFKVASFCVLAVRDFYFVVNGCCVGESHPPSPELSDTILVMGGLALRRFSPKWYRLVMVGGGSVVWLNTWWSHNVVPA